MEAGTLVSNPGTAEPSGGLAAAGAVLVQSSFPDYLAGLCEDELNEVTSSYARFKEAEELWLQQRPQAK